MNVRVGVDDLSQLKFGVGQSVRRTEDPTLVRGEGNYTDDVQVAGQLFGVFVRSAHAHGVIRRIDTAVEHGRGNRLRRIARGPQAVALAAVLFAHQVAGPRGQGRRSC